MNWRTLGRMLSAVLPAAVLAALPANAASPAAPLTVTKQLTVQEQEAATAYWTRERIAAAPAHPIPIDRGTGLVAPGAGGDAVTGPPGRTEPVEAAWDGELVARSAYWQDWLAFDDDEAAAAAAETAGAALGTAGVYTYYDVNLHTALWQMQPHRWVGRLTFVTPTGGGTCSATAISGNNIVTAAHCVYDTTANRWFTNWVFVPGYRNGGTPYGSFTANACTVLTTWVNLTGNFNIATWSRHDVAVCTLNRNSANQTLNQAVGSAGRLWNASNVQQVFNAGYPQRIYTDALIANGPTQYLRACAAETFLYTTETLGGGCYWGRGISGGSWLTQYKPFVLSGYVNSVTSGLFIGAQNLYGARFNSNNVVPLCNVRGC